MPSLEPPKPGGIGEESNLDKLQRRYKDGYRDATECIVDIYETRPSVTRVALSAWQQMTAGKTATLFQVDTRGIADAWEAYVSTAIEASRVNSSGAVSEFGGPRWVAWKNLEAAMYARGWNTGEEQDGPKRTATLDALAARYAADLRKRQRAALDTLLVAYAQEGQGAFRDPAMRDLLTTRRSQLLTDGDRWQVDPDDILDADFRSAFRESIRNIGDRPLRLGEGGGRPRRAVPGALPMPTPDNVGDGEGGEGGGGAAVAVVAGLLGLGLVARRFVRRR